MEGVLEWGINVVLWFQQFSPALDLPFEILTFMGGEEFFLALLPLLYWCLDRRTGARLTVLFLVSYYLNTVAKVLADQPRPFEHSYQVQKLYDASGGGFPSGHTQGAVVAWGYLASQCRRTWLWIVAGLLMVLIPLSRVYLGVHFPHDLLGGYLLGAALLLLYLWLEPGVEAWLAAKSLALQLGAALVLSVLLVGLLPASDCIKAGAMLMGMSVGFVLERRWVGFEASGVWWRRLLRFLLGIAVLFGLWMGLRVAFSGLEPVSLFRFVRYTLVALWGALGAPWVFTKLRLVTAQQ
jgi:membrane-associated phospholipid phosphatase/putative flippase GtrA